MKVVVVSTMAPYVTDQPDTCLAWLYTAEGLRAEAEKVGCEVDFFAALEIDGRGLAPYAAVLARLAEIGGAHWTFSLDDGSTVKSTSSRLRFITLGQNLTVDYACANWATHLLFMAADCEPPADAIPKLLEVDWPIVGGHVATYGLGGPLVEGYPFPVQQHMASAAFVMLRRDLFRFVRWRWDIDAGMSDDPCLHYDALQLHGFPTYVRHDVVGRHYPECIGAVETRGHDMTVVRADLPIADTSVPYFERTDLDYAASTMRPAEVPFVDSSLLTVVGETGCDDPAIPQPK